MNPCLYTFLALTSATGPAQPTFTELEARMQALVEQQRYADLAQEAERAFELGDLSPQQRHVMAFFAVQGLHALFETTWEQETVCHARRLLERVHAGPGPDAALLARLKQANERYVAKLSRPCPTRKPAARRPAACPSVQVEVEARAEASCRAEVAVRPRVELLGADDPVKRAPVVPDTPNPRAHLRTRGALGGVLTAVGLGAIGASIAGLGVMAGHAGAIRETARAAVDEQRPLTDAESRRIDALYAEAMTLRGPTIAAGVVGAAGLIAGVAVLASRRRAIRRLTLTPHAGLLGGGLLVRGQF